MPIEVEFTDDGYLRLPGELASKHFPGDGVVALVRGRELWLMPTHGDAAGGNLLKRRNPLGDRAVLIWEALDNHRVSGPRPAFWDAAQGALRVALEVGNA